MAAENDGNQERIVITADESGIFVASLQLVTDRRARLFFRSVIGGRAVAGGWYCPRRRLSTATLGLRIYDWLQQYGYEVELQGILEQTVSQELERRRSFSRSRTSVERLKNGTDEFDFSIVDSALTAFGWSEERRLREHQRDGVAHALTATNAANFSVPGSGKTTTMLAVAATRLHADTIDLVVVVGPLSSFGPWEKETSAAVGSRMRACRVRGTARQRQEIYAQINREDILLLSYATAAADQAALLEVFESFRVMLIVDESHRIKRFRGGFWAPALLELARRARVRSILSGTPMPQSGRDLYSQLNVIWPDGQLTGTREAFAARVDASMQSVIGSILPFVSRTSKSALGLEPPEITRHEIPLSGTQAEIYELIANRFRRQVQDADTWRDMLDALQRGRPIRLLQAATNPSLFNHGDHYYNVSALKSTTPTLMERLASYGEHKVPAKSLAALRIIEDIAEDGGKVVCWSNFVPNLDHFTQLVRSRLNLPCFQIDGRVPAGRDALHEDSMADSEQPGEVDTREAIISRFLEHEGSTVLVANPASCSESISLHHSCRNAIYLDRTYDCALFLQSIDRIHRLGLPLNATVTVHLLLSTINEQATIDHLVDQSLENKSSQMRQVLEGAELSPVNMSDSPSGDAEGNDQDLSVLLRYLLGETG